MLTLFRLFCGPVSFAFAVYFVSVIIPQLNTQTQNALNNGALGAFLGFFGGIVYLCLTVSWDEIENLLKKHRLS